LSHLTERKDKNCLNCNAQVYGRYCQVCGQENIEPAESLWHLITHFFNDITHFDGKFFSTLKLLITKPGFLPAEYKRGRRASYLNPVRMYIFTSFVFFIIFFSVYDFENSIKIDGKRYTASTIAAMDSADLAKATQELNNGKAMTREEFLRYTDSTNSNLSVTFNGQQYSNRQQYDSFINAGLIKPGWFEKKIAYKQFEISSKYQNDGNAIMNNMLSIFLHMFPQILFVSLPLFAFVLWLLYIRRKEFYFVSHGIFSVHLYIFYFITFLFLIMIKEIEELLHWSYIFNWASFILTVLLLLYEYKALRHFYQQSRAKTILKFFLAVFCRMGIFILLAIVFIIFSIFKI